MAITILPREISAAIKYTQTTDNYTDWSGVTNDTYFFDLTDKLVYYKNSLGDVLKIFDYFTGGTISGETIFNSGLSATTISATTIGSPTDCVDDLYVSNIHSCSPLNINPLDEGNVYFGSTSAVTVDLTNNRVGIGITSPTAKFHINNTTSGNTFLAEDSTNPDSSPFVIDTSGNVGIGISGTTYKLDVNGTTIHRDNVLIENGKEIFWSDTSTTWPTSTNSRIRWTLNNDRSEIYSFQPATDDIDFVFKISDNAVTSVDNFVFWIDDFSGETFDRYPLEMNGQNFIVNPTRRYALSASTSGAGNTDFYILQSGATALTQSVMFADVSTNRVGVNTSSPTETLDVNGKTKTINFQMTSGATSGYVLTSDASGNASWQSGATVNIYNSDGSLTGNRTVSQGSFDLNLNGDENSKFQTIYTSTINPLDVGQFYTNVNTTSITHFDDTNDLQLSTVLTPGNSSLGVSVPSTNEYAGVNFNSTSADLLHYDGVTTTRDVRVNSNGIWINQEYYLPNSDGTNGQVLTTDGLGNTSWQQIPTSSFTGGSVTGTTTFTGGISATTISATTIGSSGDCVDDLYVSNIHSCSPLNINPLDEGNVYFGSNSGITIDLANERLGVGTNSPQYPLQVGDSNNENLYFDPTSGGGQVGLFSKTGVPRYDVIVPANSFVQPAIGGGFGLRSWNDTSFPGYGNIGDMFLYAGANARNLNIINQTSGPFGTSDHIRFYAGTTPDLSTAHMFIDGSGGNKGYVGLGTESPSQRLDVSGNTKVRGSYSSFTPGISVGPNGDIGFYTETTSIQDKIQLRSGTAGSNIRLYNGTTSPSLNTKLTQYGSYSALEANTSTGSTTAPLYFVNEANGLIIFRTNSTDDTLYLLPSGETLSVFSATSLPVVFATGYFEGENIALRSVGTSAYVNDIRIDANGKLTTNTSDERLKENIKPITGALNTILQLSGVTYQWKDRSAGGNDERFGFIAQQVESVDSRLSFTNKVDQYKGVHTDAIIPLLVEALKEQQVVIDELKNRISALENLNN